METAQTHLLPFFEGRRQFITPIYQRPYSWTKEQCTQLWDDIVTVGTNEAMSWHFIGSVVFIQSGLYQVSRITSLLIIDGQQRLTTTTLLLIALAQLAKNSETPLEMSYDEIYDSYLVNKHGRGEQQYKLLLTGNDKETLKQLVDSPERVKNSVGISKLIENYLFFKERLESEGVDPQIVYTGISKLLLVEISLDRDRDNPQLIFESMNSTGVDLTQSDLIRNYIFMGLSEDNQSNLYYKYWSKTEKIFDDYKLSLTPIEKAQLMRINLRNSATDTFDIFMRDYLTLKNGTICPINKVYLVFKSYRNQISETSIFSIVKEIYDYATIYSKITLTNDEDTEISRILQDIKKTMGTFTYPTMLEIYYDYSQQLLSREDFIKILKFFESYFLRGLICRIPLHLFNIKTLGGHFDKTHYLESVFNFFLNEIDESIRMPRDHKFIGEFISINMYTIPIRNYVLSKLENYKRKEFTNVEGYTIEHIMPQNITNSEAWKKELGERWKETHSYLLHTIGNLTLTGYNSELSNRPFKEKRDMEGGFADSPIHLNRSIAKLEHWDENEILSRAMFLAKQATQIWPMPIITQQEEENAERGTKGKKYTIKSHHALKGNLLVLFENLQKRIMNLDISVKEEITKNRILYRSITLFAQIEPHKMGLKIILDTPSSDIKKSNNIHQEAHVETIPEIINTEINIESLDQIDEAMNAIRRSFEKQREEISLE